MDLQLITNWQLGLFKSRKNLAFIADRKMVDKNPRMI